MSPSFLSAHRIARISFILNEPLFRTGDFLCNKTFCDSKTLKLYLIILTDKFAVSSTPKEYLVCNPVEEDGYLAADVAVFFRMRAYEGK